MDDNGDSGGIGNEWILGWLHCGQHGALLVTELLMLVFLGPKKITVHGDGLEDGLNKNMVGMAHSTIPDVTAIDQPFAVLLLPDAVEVVGKWVNRSSTEEQHTVDCASIKMDYKKMTIHEDGRNLK